MKKIILVLGLVFSLGLISCSMPTNDTYKDETTVFSAIEFEKDFGNVEWVNDSLKTFNTLEDIEHYVGCEYASWPVLDESSITAFGFTSSFIQYKIFKVDGKIAYAFYVSEAYRNDALSSVCWSYCKAYLK